MHIRPSPETSMPVCFGTNAELVFMTSLFLSSPSPRSVSRCPWVYPSRHVISCKVQFSWIFRKSRNFDRDVTFTKVLAVTRKGTSRVFIYICCTTSTYLLSPPRAVMHIRPSPETSMPVCLGTNAELVPMSSLFLSSPSTQIIPWSSSNFTLSLFF
jgi:hypothetical protein